MSRDAFSDTPSGVVSELMFRPMPYEVDFTGILSNTVAPRWMEALRVNLMDTHFPHFDNSAPEHLSVIAETKIQYLKPARYHDVIRGQAWLESASFSRWVIAFRFDFQGDGPTMMRARQVGAFVDPQRLTPVRIPAAVRQLIVNGSST